MERLKIRELKPVRELYGKSRYRAVMQVQGSDGEE